MRTLKTFFFLILALNSMFSQKILDYANPHILLDMLYVEGCNYNLESIGSCQYGLLRSDCQGENSLAYNYIVHGNFYYDDDLWFALSMVRDADDVGGNYIALSYKKNGELQNFVNYDEAFISFNAFTRYQDSLILLFDQYPKEFHIIDFEAKLIETIEVSDNYDMLLNFQGEIYGTIENKLIKLNNEFSPIDNYSFEQTILDQFIYMDNLYLIFENSIQAFDAQLNEIWTYQTENDHRIQDLSVRNDTLFSLERSNNAHIINAIIDQEAIELSFYENDYITLESFVKNDPKLRLITSVNLGGLNDELTSNSVIATIEELEEENDDFAIEIDTINTTTEIYHWEIYPNGDTLEILEYHYDISFSIHNLSDTVLDKCFIVSTQHHAFNCAVAQLYLRFENLNLLPGSSISIDTSFHPSYIPFPTFCLYLISANGNVDTNFDNNASCRITTNLGPAQQHENYFIYPNPAHDRIIMSEKIQESQIFIVNLEGKDYSDQCQFGEKNIEIDGLPQGVYILILKAKNTKPQTLKFIKM